MTEPSSPAVPAGWYPDPAGDPRPRWWDGAQWTDQYAEPYSQRPAAVAERAPEGTNVQTPWIWILVFLPLVPLVPLFFLDVASFLSPDALTDPTGMAVTLGLVTSPAYVALVVLGFAVTVLSIVFAYVDWRALQKAGVPRPFHFAWVFLIFVVGSAAVYTIGRAVVAKRRTGHGIAPMWATIAVLITTFLVAIGWTIWIMVETVESLAGLPGF